MDGVIGTIILFGGNFAPRNWAFCQGQLLSIAANTALFSILGTTYGGDGRTTFALPDLRGRVPLSAGQGPGLSNHTLGQQGGAETVTLQVTQIPAHNHTVAPLAKNGGGDDTSPTNKFMATASTDLYADANNTNMGASPSSMTGGGGAHNNMQPFLALNYVICLNGIFPSRS